MIEYEDIFDQLNIMGYLKTIPLEGIFRTTKVKSRKCNTCSEYNQPKKGMCIPVGIIINPDCGYCSWWKEKFEKIIKTKRCSECGKVKPIDRFYKDKSSSDGHQYKCSRCAIEYGKEYQRNNKKTKEIIGV